MAKGAHGFVAFRLRESREARGMSAASLADAINVSRQSVSQYERGKQVPSFDILNRISSVLQIPVQRFLLRGPEHDLGTVFYRSMASATKTARARAQRRFGWMLDCYGILREFLEFRSVDLPDLHFPNDPSRISMDDVDAAAQSVRDAWNVGSGPVADLTLLLESHGIIVARTDLWADTLDAFSVWSPEFNRPFIVLSTSKESACRSRFDAAHELGHLLLHRQIDPVLLGKKAEFNLIESQAHRFASALLLPEAEFLDELYSPSLDVMQSIKSKWRVSIAAMIQRACQLDAISDEDKRRLFMNMGRRRWRTREPLDAVLEIESPRVLSRAAEKLIEGNYLHRNDFPLRLSLPEKDVEEVLCLPKGFLSAAHRPTDPAEPTILQMFRKATG